MSQEQQHEAGIFAHLLMPTKVDGPILSLWECQDNAMDASDFQSFIDEATSFATNLINKVYPIRGPTRSIPSVLPTSAWPAMPAATIPSSGSFFWVKHVFRSENSAAFSLADHRVMMEGVAARNKAEGFHNHHFMPTADPKIVFCVWESQVPMDAGEFQDFVDDEIFGGTLSNEVYPVMVGGKGNVPSAAFPHKTVC